MKQKKTVWNKIEWWQIMCAFIVAAAGGFLEGKSHTVPTDILVMALLSLGCILTAGVLLGNQIGRITT